MPSPARVLVTGGRDYADAKKVGDYIAVAFKLLLGDDGTLGPLMTVVHGGARGADHLAHLAAIEFGMVPEPHPAQWNAPCRDECLPNHRKMGKDGKWYCPAAGSGTADCVRRIKKAGIELIEVT